MTDREIEVEIAAIRHRLEGLAEGSVPAVPALPEELGAIRAQLRELAESNEQARKRLGESQMA